MTDRDQNMDTCTEENMIATGSSPSNIDKPSTSTSSNRKPALNPVKAARTKKFHQKRKDLIHHVGKATEMIAEAKTPIEKLRDFVVAVANSQAPQSSQTVMDLVQMRQDLLPHFNKLEEIISSLDECADPKNYGQ